MRSCQMKRQTSNTMLLVCTRDLNPYTDLRIKRELESANASEQVKYGFKTLKPWKALFAVAVLESEKFWNSEV